MPFQPSTPIPFHKSPTGNKKQCWNQTDDDALDCCKCKNDTSCLLPCKQSNAAIQDAAGTLIPIQKKRRVGRPIIHDQEHHVFKTPPPATAVSMLHDDAQPCKVMESTFSINSTKVTKALELPDLPDSPRSVSLSLLPRSSGVRRLGKTTRFVPRVLFA